MDVCMPYLIGTDEAGYGPNLGPLVIAATVWHIDDDLPPAELYKRLKKCVASKPVKDDRRLAIADSKSLYTAGQGLAALELGVLAALSLLKREPACWRELWPVVLTDEIDSLHQLAPWHLDFDQPLPIEIEAARLSKSRDRLSAGLDCAGVRLINVCATAVLPHTFNDMVDRYGSKGELLSLTTLKLAAHAIDSLPRDCQTGETTEPIIVTCDKHGGRGHYTGQLQHIFPDDLIQVRLESRAESIYRCGPGHRYEFRFMTKGERMLPTALASMTAKYLRELAMIPFNQFWQQHVPGLKATAGYPGDATRFWDEIRPAQQRLGITDRVLWRCR
jgi:ribonuclease HII